MANILPTEKKVAVVSMLAEGNSIRAIERMTGIHRDTVMRLGVRVGEGCAKIQDAKMRGLNCARVEVDEIWGFIGAKRRNAAAAGVYGDVWTFIALDADTKLIPSFIVGKRDAYHAKAFIFDLTGHPKAKRAYAWSHPDGVDDFDEKFTAVLEVPPVDSAKTAVKVAIVAEYKRHQSN